jgi:hypothetical protein
MCRVSSAIVTNFHLVGDVDKGRGGSAGVRKGGIWDVCTFHSVFLGT